LRIFGRRNPIQADYSTKSSDGASDDYNLDDLGYSSVLFGDNELAEEVIELEEKVEDLKTLLLMNTAIVIKDAEGIVGIIEIGVWLTWFHTHLETSP